MTQGESLEELVRRMVDLVHPTRIILFGSAARGDMEQYGDEISLVICPALTEGRELYRAPCRPIRPPRHSGGLAHQSLGPSCTLT